MLYNINNDYKKEECTSFCQNMTDKLKFKWIICVMFL